MAENIRFELTAPGILGHNTNMLYNFRYSVGLLLILLLSASPCPAAYSVLPQRLPPKKTPTSAATPSAASAVSPTAMPQAASNEGTAPAESNAPAPAQAQAPAPAQAQAPAPAQAQAPAPAQAQAPAPAPKAAQASAPIPAAQTAITRVVGEAGGNFITSREAKINSALEQAIYQLPPGATAPKVLRGDEDYFSTEVSSVLLEWVVYLEAKSFVNEVANKAEVQKQAKLALELLMENPEWTNLDASSEEVTEIIERKQIAKQFIRLKSDSSLVPVSDSEALSYYQKNRLKFGGLPFSSFKDNIKAYLVKVQTEQRLRSWFDVLNHKYKVRNFIAG